MRATRLVALFTLFAGPVLAQSNVALMANDHYTRSHDYDLVHQRIEVSDFNWDSLSFSGRVTTTLVALRPNMDSVILDEGALLDNREVKARNGAALRTTRHGDTLVVFPAAPLAFHDTLVFTVSYQGKVHNGSGLTFITSDGLPHRPRQIWSQGEADDNHDWFPTFDFPSDKMTWEVQATVPSEDMAVSNGRLVSDVRRGATRTLTWNQDRPSATYLVSLVVAPLAKIHDEWHGIPVDYYVYHDDSTKAWPLFHVTTDMINTYSTLTGVPYPWAKYAETTVADFFGGMENVSATTLVDWLPDARAYQDRPWYQWLLIPHELAHQWFGDYVTTENWANMWLNEGFAEFMPGQYWGGRLGAHAEQDYYADEYRQFMNIERRRSMPLASLGSNNIYPKGALVLEMLKHYLGPQPFWASIHRYLTDHALAGATSDDLRQAVLAATGQNLDWFWNEWVYQAGYPQFDVSANYDAAGHAVTLIVRQTQTDTLTADSTGLRFTVPAAFRMPLTVRVGTAAGDVTQRFEVGRRTDTLTVGGVMSEPTMVVFDDGNNVLKSLHFDEPTAWLAMQLGRDADLWDRQWVIGQLATRTGDAQAAQALADAAQHADYYLTRVQAATALARFAGPATEQALEGAMRDTSSAVRAAALGTLARLGGAHAAQLAHDAFANDSSYEVRAAALTALARTDSAGIHAEIAAAVSIPSYRDAIQDAALGAMAATNDTSFIATVDQLLGSQAGQTPALVLARFAADGNAHAEDVLRRRLDDERAAVRRVVLRAVRFAMPQPAALALLRSAVDGITHPDAKDEVQRALHALEAQPDR